MRQSSQINHKYALMHPLDFKLHPCFKLIKKPKVILAVLLQQLYGQKYFNCVLQA